MAAGSQSRKLRDNFSITNIKLRVNWQCYQACTLNGYSQWYISCSKAATHDNLLTSVTDWRPSMQVSWAYQICIPTITLTYNSLFLFFPILKHVIIFIMYNVEFLYDSWVHVHNYCLLSPSHYLLTSSFQVVLFLFSCFLFLWISEFK